MGNNLSTEELIWLVKLDANRHERKQRSKV